MNIHGKRPVPGGSGGQAATPGPLLTGTKGAPAPGVAGAGGGGGGGGRGLPREPPARGRRGLPSPPRSQRQPVFLHIFAYGEAARRVSSAPARLAGQSRRGQGSPAAAARSAPRPVPRAPQRGRPRRGLRPARPGPPSSTAIATSLRHPLLSGGPRRAGPPWPTAALSPWRRSARGTGPRRRGYRQRHGSGTSRAGHLHRAALPPPPSGPAPPRPEPTAEAAGPARCPVPGQALPGRAARPGTCSWLAARPSAFQGLVLSPGPVTCRPRPLFGPRQAPRQRAAARAGRR